MPYPALTFAHLLESVTRQELEQFVSLLQGFFSAQHKDDGTHANLTADLITFLADAGDGTFTGNLANSLVPTASTVDLGATSTNASGRRIDHPFRNLRLSGSINWNDYQDSGIAVAGRPVLARSGNNITFDSQGTVIWTLTSGVNTHTITFGRGLSGLTSDRDIHGDSVGATTSISATTGYFERSRSTRLGEWIDVTFNAGDYTTSSAATWTLASGDRLALRYTLIGKTMILDFQLNTTSVSAATAAELRIAIPGGFTAAGRYSNTFRAYDNGVERLGEAIVLGSGTVVALYANPSSGAAWAASTDNTGAFGQLTFEIA